MVTAFFSAMASWWIVGDISEGQGGGDRAFDLVWARQNAWLIGVLGLLGSILALAHVLRRPDVRRRRVFASIACALSAGATVSIALRVATAEVSGANIGAVYALTLALVLTPTLLYASVRMGR